MGTPQFSVQLLKTLTRSSYKISCVYTQGPKKSNRGQKLNLSSIHKISQELQLNVRTPKNLNSTEEFKYFKELNPDIVIVAAYGQIIPKKFIDIPKNGFINIHTSLLPRWRGAAPIQRSIINLDKEIGISIMKIQEGLDVGPVMKQIKIDIIPTDTSADISQKLSKIASDNIIEVLESIFEDKAKFIEQEHKLATYAKKIKKSEGKINWEENAKNIIGKINGLNPDPGAWFEYKEERFKIWKASIFEKKGTPGIILDNNFIIGCKDKSIKIIEIQRQGKKKLRLENFLPGMNFNIGDSIN